MTSEQEYIEKIKEIELEMDKIRWMIFKLHDKMTENQIIKKSEE